MRKEMGLFANLRPAKVLPQLIDASTLKREVVEGVDLMVVRELTGDVYFGTPKGIDVVDGQRVGYNNMIYAEHEIDRIARVAGRCLVKVMRDAFQKTFITITDHVHFTTLPKVMSQASVVASCAVSTKPTSWMFLSFGVRSLLTLSLRISKMLS